jgi:hypothetical protein
LPRIATVRSRTDDLEWCYEILHPKKLKRESRIGKAGLTELTAQPEFYTQTPTFRTFACTVKRNS